MDAFDERITRTNKHVFVINRAVEVLELVRELLNEDEFNVTTTNFVPRTWDQIDALQPDLLMVDLVVGQDYGWTLLEKLRQQASTRNIPVIIFSTDPNLLEQAERQLDRYGGQSFVLKPFNIDVLLGAVHDLIGHASRD